MPTLLRLLARRLVALAGFGLGMVVVGLVGSSAQIFAAPADTRVAPGPPTRVERLIAAHDCWTTAAPADQAGQLPGHVVVSRPGRAAVWSTQWVGPALEQTFSDVPDRRRELVVHAFCP